MPVPGEKANMLKKSMNSAIIEFDLSRGNFGPELIFERRASLCRGAEESQVMDLFQCIRLSFFRSAVRRQGNRRGGWR